MRSIRTNCALAFALLWTLWFVSGCSSKASSNSAARIATEDSKSANEHEQEHDHEHFPPHWPVDIFQASERLEGLTNGKLTARDNLPAMREISDLMKWLPMLAADSDLSREDFYRIDALSSDWTKPLTQHAEQGGEMGDFLGVSSLQEAVGLLVEVCRKEKERIRAMQPEEDSSERSSQNDSHR